MAELNCTKCGEIKDLSEFSREARNTQRHQRRSHCKSCDANKHQLYVSDQEKKDRRNSKRVEWNRRTKSFFAPGLYEERLEEQDNRCAICKVESAGGRGAFHADHDHKTSTPRGALCHRCNIALGHFRDDISILTAAIEYLNKYAEVK